MWNILFLQLPWNLGIKIKFIIVGIKAFGFDVTLENVYTEGATHCIP